jgi:hypothetical protein
VITGEQGSPVAGDSTKRHKPKGASSCIRLRGIGRS